MEYTNDQKFQIMENVTAKIVYHSAVISQGRAEPNRDEWLKSIDSLSKIKIKLVFSNWEELKEIAETEIVTPNS